MTDEEFALSETEIAEATAKVIELEGFLRTCSNGDVVMIVLTSMMGRVLYGTEVSNAPGMDRTRFLLNLCNAVKSYADDLHAERRTMN